MNQQEITAATVRQGLISEWRDKEDGSINRVYRRGGVLVFENEETIFPDGDGEPPVVAKSSRGNNVKVTDGTVIVFGYKSVDGLGQGNLAKIADLKVDGPAYTATLTDGHVITAHGIADFAKQLRAYKL
jgi:predicted metalloprotease with PDZ domain